MDDWGRVRARVRVNWCAGCRRVPSDALDILNEDRKPSASPPNMSELKVRLLYRLWHVDPQLSL